MTNLKLGTTTVQEFYSMDHFNGFCHGIFHIWGLRVTILGSADRREAIAGQDMQNRPGNCATDNEKGVMVFTVDAVEMKWECVDERYGRGEELYDSPAQFLDMCKSSLGMTDDEIKTTLIETPNPYGWEAGGFTRWIEGEGIWSEVLKPRECSKGRA